MNCSSMVMDWTTQNPTTISPLYTYALPSRNLSNFVLPVIKLGTKPSDSGSISLLHAGGENAAEVTQPLSTDPTTDLALRSLSFGVRRVRKQGVSGSKNGCLFSSVSAVRFKETAKPAAPQDRSDKCSTAANRALPLGATPPSGSRGNGELKTPYGVRDARIVAGNSAVGRRRYISVGQGRTGRAEVDPGTVRVATGRRKHGMKYRIMRERAFGIGDDCHFPYIISESQLALSPLPKATASPLLALRARCHT
jgi:hypothetical protein